MAKRHSKPNCTFQACNECWPFLWLWSVDHGVIVWFQTEKPLDQVDKPAHSKPMLALRLERRTCRHVTPPCVHTDSALSRTICRELLCSVIASVVGQMAAWSSSDWQQCAWLHYFLTSLLLSWYFSCRWIHFELTLPCTGEKPDQTRAQMTALGAGSLTCKTLYETAQDETLDTLPMNPD